MNARLCPEKNCQRTTHIHLNTIRGVTIAFALISGLTRAANGADSPDLISGSSRDVSFRNEVEHAIDRGLDWLQTHQNSNGWWSTADQPAVTGLALMSFKGDPSGRYSKSDPEWLSRGYTYVLSCARPDGGIHRTNLVTYNTSICMMALLAANKPEYEPVLLKARHYLIGLQGDFGEKGKIDTPFDGGIGYGSHHDHSDMANTLQALEAIHYTQYLARDKGSSQDKDLNWAAAIHFLQSCQQLRSHNPENWVSEDPQNKGGFIYFPGASEAGSTTNAETGRVSLRSYGSISYAGLLSYVYADLRPDDPRVIAVFDWLRKNYTIEENPALGPQGLYYYYHTMAKALTAYNVADLELTDGKRVAWRRQLSQKLLDLEQKDGSWVNEKSGRWWEKDPTLVTAYAVLTLETIHRGL
jgi:squalene-hopene/tetraprenyl-beta-curcumene cyclase